jgi:hypothetical protein
MQDLCAKFTIVCSRRSRGDRPLRIAPVLLVDEPRMGPSCDLDVFGDLIVAGDPAAMYPIQDLGQQMGIRGIRLRARGGAVPDTGPPATGHTMIWSRVRQ